MPTVTTTQQQDVTIATITQARLVHKLKAWQDIQQEIAALEQAKAALVDEIEAIRAIEVGVNAFAVEGYKIARIESTTTSFDKKRFVTLGGDLALYEAAQVTKPRKPYTRITAPGQKEREW